MNWKFWEKEENEEAEELPMIGEKWCLKCDFDGSPWPKKDVVCVIVLDVKDGWVRYRIGEGLLFGDERMKVKYFTRVYKKVTTDKKVVGNKCSFEEWLSLYSKDKNNDDRGFGYPIVRAAFEAGKNSVVVK